MRKISNGLYIRLCKSPMVQSNVLGCEYGYSMCFTATDLLCLIEKAPEGASKSNCMCKGGIIGCQLALWAPKG